MAERATDLVGARVVAVRVDGGLAYLELKHRGCDDDAAIVLVRIPEIEWRYPREPGDG